MKLILKTNSPNTYVVKLPNHLDISNLDAIVDEAGISIPPGEKIESHMLYSDHQLTLEEKVQLDTTGRISRPLIPLEVDIFQ